MYSVTWGLTIIGTWVLRDYASDSFAQHVGAVATFCGTADPAEVAGCAGGQIAMRISFANFVFFALHAVVMFNTTKESDPRVAFHAGGWLLKLLLWAGTLVGFFFVPAQAVNNFAQAARIGSGIFLVLQLVLLIHLLYEVNEWLVEQDSRPAWAALVVGSALCFGLGLAAIGVSYAFYTASPSCHVNLFFCTWSLVAGLMLVGALFVPNRAPSAGLLTSGAVLLYCSWLLLSALGSESPDDVCTKGSGVGMRWLQIVGFFIAIGTVLYSTISAGTASRDMFANKQEADLDASLPYRADFFHVVFALASMYIAMLFSNWQISSSGESFDLGSGWFSVWVKMASKWACEILYVWTVIAPAILTDRDFA